MRKPSTSSVVVCLMLLASTTAMVGNAVAATGSTTVAPGSDTYVNSASPDRNYGTNRSLYVDGGPNEAIAYVAFDLTPLAGATITGATLRLVATSSIYAGTGGTVEVRDVSGAAWDESGPAGITYQTRLAAGGTVLGAVSSTSPNRVEQIGLLPSALQARAGAILTVSLSLANNNGAYFWSREVTDPTLRPELVILTTDGTTTTTTQPGGTPTSNNFDAAVVASSDDAEELPTGYLDTTSSDLELVYEKALQSVGIRFRGVTIPQGATIDSAWVQFTVDEVSTGPAALSIRAQAAGNPPTFVGSRNITSRALTPASVSWTPASWPTVGAAGADQRTPDLKSLIQATVTRSDWATGNSIVLVITGSGTRTAESFNGTAAPRLHIAWHTGTATSPPPPPTGSDPVVVAVGDIACRVDKTHKVTPTTCQHKATSDVALALDPDAVLALGDNQYPGGSLVDFQKYYDPTWGRLKAITHPVPGNKEYGTGGAAGYFDYFYPGNQSIRQTGYYSFDVGEWHMVALNSECAAVSCAVGSAQEQWLRADLAATNASCVLAYWHEPMFTSGTRGGTAEVRPLYQALYDYGVDVLLSGHMHFYERFAPQNPSGVLDPQSGIRQFVVGTGGKSILNIGNGSYPNRVVRDTTSFGVLKLTLHPDSYDWEFVPAAGYSFTDSGSDVCR